MAKVIRAQSAGFCMGVDLALRKLNQVLEESLSQVSVCTLGPIIHNPQVLQRYAALGVRQLQDPHEVPPGSKLVIRAHGVSRELHQALLQKGVQVVDATCPKVKKAQRLIAEQGKKGRSLLLFGEREHPEVAGLLSYAREQAQVFESLQELQGLDLKSGQAYFLAAQTTQDRREYNQIQEHLQARVDAQLPVFDTICDTTRQRQQEALQLALQVDLVVVVGGYNSGNTRRLAQVVRSSGVQGLHVQDQHDLPLQDLQGIPRIGLTAGASTPGDVIDKVQQALERLD
ncbi:MAG: 4-hydroxy-3-methylbut-2-enyl diphosphate reductase [Desulfohalobiaceae bacterium]